MSEPKQCCGRQHLPYSVVGAHKLPYQTSTVKPLACLRVPTVWQVPTSATPEEDNTTSHVHLTSNSVLGAYHHPMPTGVGNKV